MKRISLLFLLLLPLLPVCATTHTDSLLYVLDHVIKERHHTGRQHRIDSLKMELSRTTNDSIQYVIYRSLYQVYRPFRMDSALWVADNRLVLAQRINNPYYINSSSINMAEILGATGMYKEALEILDTLHTEYLDHSRRSYYFHVYHSIYVLMAENAFSDATRTYYRAKSNEYKDSILSINTPGSLHYKTMLASKLTFNDQYEEALPIMLDCYDIHLQKGYNMGSIAYGLSEVYQHLGDREKQKKYLTISALNDIRSGGKEYISLWKLAQFLFDEGEIDRAYNYTKCSMEDAIFCNARYRAMQIAEMLPIVNAAYDAKIKRENQRMMLSLLLISTLSVILLIAIYFIRTQMKKVSVARISMKELNEKLYRINEDLNRLNTQLRESNKVKEEYIGQVFNMCSSYINKLEDFRKNLHRKVKTGQIDDIFRITKSSSLVADELKELFRNFDAIFLTLYPNFIAEFNSLLREEEQILPKEGELLTPEIRIYALIRLGIHDSTKIAGFLHFSPQTVYNYRMRVRNKLRINRKEFSEAIQHIGL